MVCFLLCIIESDHIWEESWNVTKSDWFKVETLQDYSGEDKCESLDAWLSGNKSLSISLLKNEMSKGIWIKDFQNAKFKKTRIHIVKQPFTEYLEWEFNHYRHINIPLCGEQIYLIDYSKLNNVDIPLGDFTIFDSKRVIQNHYDSNGKAIEIIYFSENDDVSMYIKLKDILLKRAEVFVL